jgi:N-dimethylarginine dimethylaminohydrolase
MAKKKILMCPPDYFEIEYSINPWMNPVIKVDKAEAFKQYNALKDEFQKAGGEIVELQPSRNLPDMIYTSNAGYAEEDVFIKANFKAHQRQHESAKAEKYFKENKYQIFEVPENIIFEGEGDLIRSKSKYFLGWGQRSDLIAKDYIEDIIGKEVLALELVDPYFYHLDTCFGPLNDNIVVLNENAFSEESLIKIYEKFRTVIATNEQDNSVLGSNLVVIGNNVILGKGISDDLRSEIRKHKFNVIEIDMSEFLKGGGSVKCLALEIF